MKNTLLLLSFIICTNLLFGQERDHEKIKALKVGFITEQLELTSKEAQSFWPVYNAYDKKHNDLRDEERSLMNGDKSSIQQMSEEEAREIIKRMQALEAAQEIAEVQYINDLKEVLSAKKIIMLFRAEKEFRRKLLHRLREKRSNNPKRQPR